MVPLGVRVTKGGRKQRRSACSVADGGIPSVDGADEEEGRLQTRNGRTVTTRGPRREHDGWLTVEVAEMREWNNRCEAAAEAMQAPAQRPQAGAQHEEARTRR